jgi:predicted metal-binding membrane protein
MKPRRHNQYEVNAVVLTISSFVWIVLLINSGNKANDPSAHPVIPCGVIIQGGNGIHPQSEGLSFRKFAISTLIPRMVAGWVVMIIAMMLPKLLSPINHVCTQCFKNRRVLLSSLFVAGYLSAWLMAGIGIIMIQSVMQYIFGFSYLPVLIIGIITLGWQFSPIKQKCLNKGHEHPVIAAFGNAAIRGALNFGINHGLWCAGAGWALMLLPMLLPDFHIPAMVVVTIIMFGEHLEHPKVPRWRIDFRGKLFRIIMAQTLLRVKTGLKRSCNPE